MVKENEYGSEMTASNPNLIVTTYIIQLPK